MPRKNQKSKKKKAVKKKTAKRKPVSKKKPKKRTVKKAGKKAGKKVQAIKRAKAKKRRPRKTTRKKTAKRILGKRIEVKEETVYGAALHAQAQEPIEKPQFKAEDFAIEKKVENEPVLYENELQNFEIEDHADFYEPEQSSLSERQKKIIMYSAVTIIMAFIIGFWFLAIKSSLGGSINDFISIEAQNFKKSEELDQALNNLQDGWDQVNGYLNQKDGQLDELMEKTKDTIIEEKVKNDIADIMEEKLKDIPLENETNKNLNNNINTPLE